MSENKWTSLAMWERNAVTDDQGDVAMCFGLAVTMYFRAGHTEEKRRAILECFDEYQRLCGSALRWWVTEDKWLSPVTKLKSRDMSPYLLSRKFEEPAAYDRTWAFLWHGAEKKESASPFLIEAFGASKMDMEVHDGFSYLRVSFPVTWFEERVEDFLRLILRWSERVQPVHGYGGVTLIRSPNDGFSQMHEEEESGFAARYPGIEIDDPLGHSMRTQTGIKGGNWITILSKAFVEKLGGAAELREHLGTGFRVEEYSGGAMIVAGPVPEIGDRNRNIDTPHYRRLAQVLKPIRIDRHPPIQVRGRLSEEGAFAAWLARFDD
ncbi:MAG TPA: type VI immunity family protein [Archangium sp.]|nr:type VI immunity family protein [Archangium sp.]